MDIRSTVLRLKAEGWSVVEEWISSREPESVFLDFKQSELGEDLDAKEEDKKGSDNRNLAKTMSAFANTDGGLLVFGIDAKKDKAGRDHATRVQRNSQLAELARLLRSRLLNATCPAVPGADVVGPIFDPNDSALGIVVVVVPQSDGGPHRALLDEKVKDRYYHRTETSCAVAAHSTLEGWFGRRPQPKLRLVLSRNRDHTVTASIVNEGRGAARSPRLFLAMGPAERAATTDGRDDTWIIRTNSRGWSCQAERNIIVFPDDELRVGRIRVPADGVLDGRIDADGARPVRVEGMFPTDVGDAKSFPPSGTDDAEVLAMALEAMGEGSDNQG